MTEDETLEPGMQQNILDAIFFLLHLCMAEFSCCLFDHLLYLLCAISYPSYQIGKNFTKICLLNCDAEGVGKLGCGSLVPSHLLFHA